MGVINVLSFAVANLIAAGEVVDRPASVIKELMENAIDAGATRVTVEIQHGGVTFMRVTDNGCGMSPDDLPVAIRRHATSKIKEAADLEGIATLGFRGEALAAIASVSDLRIISKTADAPFGALLQAHGGEHITVTEQGCSTGTSVIVENLFANVPARRKFLKKDVTETMAVTAYVEKIALSNPGLAVRLVVDGTVKLETAGDGSLKSAIYALFGREFANRLIEVNGENEGITVKGYIGRTDNYKANRNFENFFVNGRYVKSKTATAALEQAFTSYMPPERFPCCVLYIDVNPARVDVNVHPAKLEVKFSNEKAVFEAVYYTVRTALESNASRPAMNLESGLRRSRPGGHGRMSDATVPVENERPEALRTRQLSYDLSGRSQPQPQERMTAEEYRQMMQPGSRRAEGQIPSVSGGRKPSDGQSQSPCPAPPDTAVPQNGRTPAASPPMAGPVAADVTGQSFASASAGAPAAEESAHPAVPNAADPRIPDPASGQNDASNSGIPEPAAVQDTASEGSPIDPREGGVPLPDPAPTPLLHASLAAGRADTGSEPTASGIATADTPVSAHPCDAAGNAHAGGVSDSPASAQAPASGAAVPPDDGAAREIPGPDSAGASAPSNVPADGTLPSPPPYRLVGDVFHAYVIVELEDKMLIIDQHAAHERILFEQLKAGLHELEPSSQLLMLPVDVMMTSAEAEVLKQYDEELRKIGFSLRYARNTVSADAIPEGVETGAVADMLQTMAGRLLDNTGSVRLTRDIIFEKALYQAACKAAIKAGRVYAPGHIEWLVDRLMRLPDITFCPHGRPVAMELSRRTLDRQFDRTGF